MSFKSSGDHATLKSAFALKALPLGASDMVLLQFAVDDIAPGWTVELSDVCADDASLILLPDGGEDSIGPSFAVTRESYGLRLDQVRWDEMTEIGVYPSLPDVLEAIRCCVAFCTNFTAIGSATIH